ncbi:hypothetical protein BGW38_004011, partial [Lunasporangiospora selenospora]
MATKDTQNQEVLRTLKFMNASHTRQAKDLQRRVSKAAAEAAAAAAAAAATAAAVQVPGPSKQTRRSGSISSTKTDSSANTSVGNHGSAGRRREGSLGQGHSGGMTLQPHGEAGEDSRTRLDAVSFLTTSSDASSNSSSAVEESFTFVKNHMKDESDPFNKFWEAVENLVLKISSPVAFTSIPLDGDDPLLLNSGSTVLQPPAQDEPSYIEPISAPFPVPGNAAIPPNSHSHSLVSQTRAHESRLDRSSMQESFFIVDPTSVSNNHSSARTLQGGSRPLVPSLQRLRSTGRPSRSDTTPIRQPSPTKTLEEYAIENQQLKLTLDKLSKRNLKMEKHLEGLMQMSVWTKDVQRSAMQLMKSQDILRPVRQSIQDLSAGHPELPSLSSGATGTTMQAHLKELVEEVQQLRLENTKLNSLMKKYKQRWEDLKESAKKRRNAQPNAATSPTPPGQDPDFDGQTETTMGINNDPSPSSGDPTAMTSRNRPPTAFSSPYSQSSLVGNPHQRRVLQESINPGGLGGNSGSGYGDSTSPLGVNRYLSMAQTLGPTTVPMSPRVLDSTGSRSGTGLLSTTSVTTTGAFVVPAPISAPGSGPSVLRISSPSSSPLGLNAGVVTSTPIP